MQKMNINKHHQQGVGLIEVLVSLLLLAVAVLGYSALQLTAVKLTHESTQRTQATMILRNLGEQLRINPAGLGTYIEALNKGDLTKPTKGCGLYGQTSAVCSAHQLAVVEAYQIQQKLTKYGLSLHLQACPANRANSTCGIISWGDTLPAIGSTSSVNSSGGASSLANANTCVDDKGAYQAKSTCLVMELL